MFDFDYDPEDFLAAVEGRYRHKNRGKRRPIIQTNVLLQETDDDD